MKKLMTLLIVLLAFSLLACGHGRGRAGAVNRQADVIIVGGGMGGLSTAIFAAQSGASVIVLEKTPMLGGSTVFGGGLTVAGSRWQAEQGVTFNAQEMYDGWVGLQRDDPQQMGFYNRALIRPMVDRSGERFNRLLDLGYVPQFHLGTSSVQGDPGRMLISSTPPGWTGRWTGSFFVEFLENTARNLGVDIHMTTRGLELIQARDGRITGVIARGPDGEIRYQANNAVVLATGGISRNPELMQRFLPNLAPFVPFTTAAIGHMGDGLIMAEAVGAVPHDDFFLIGLGLQNEFSGMFMGGPGILVNQEGRRYVMETRPRGFIDHYSYIYNFTVAHAPGGAFYVFDSHEAFAAHIQAVENNINHANAFRANTIADLARAMGVPPANLQAEVDQINAAAAGQAPDRLGRTVGIRPISQAPFYAMRMFPMDMGTIGGVVTNEYYQVLNANGQVIPGLFAVGEMSNRRYIAPMYFSGLSLTVTLSQSIVAGEKAARLR